jgi:hypothetical protein
VQKYDVGWWLARSAQDFVKRHSSLLIREVTLFAQNASDKGGHPAACKLQHLIMIKFKRKHIAIGCEFRKPLVETSKVCQIRHFHWAAETRVLLPR